MVGELAVSKFDIVETLDGVDAWLVFGPAAQLFLSGREGSSSNSGSEFREGLLTANESSVIIWRTVRRPTRWQCLGLSLLGRLFLFLDCTGKLFRGVQSPLVSDQKIPGSVKDS